MVRGKTNQIGNKVDYANGNCRNLKKFTRRVKTNFSCSF